MLKKYFSAVPLWLSIAANAVLGFIDMELLIAGVLSIHGLDFYPTAEDRMHGYLFLACIPIGILAVHFTVFFICRKNRGNENIPSGKVTLLYSAANAVIFVAAAFLSMLRFW